MFFQMDMAREAETSSPQPEPAEEPMEESHAEPSDPREPIKEVEADEAEADAGNTSEAVE